MSSGTNRALWPSGSTWVPHPSAAAGAADSLAEPWVVQKQNWHRALSATSSVYLMVLSRSTRVPARKAASSFFSLPALCT